MRNRLTALALSLAAFMLAFAAVPAGAVTMTPGNVVIYRVGDGLGALGSGIGTAVFLDEYSPTGTLVQTIALPTTTVLPNKRIVAAGTAATEGLLTRSVDGSYIVLTGYDAAPGATGLTTSTSATVNRVIARINASGTVDTTTALTDASTGSSPRGVAATDGTNFWISGGAGGVRYTTLGATTSTQISTTVTNLRGVSIYGGQLYISTQSGAVVRLGSVGSGTPTAAGSTITNLPGYSTTSAPNPFVLLDLDAGVPGVDTLYVADETAGNIQKWSLVAGSWTFNGAITAATVRGLTASVSGTTVTLFATYSAGAKLCSVVDTAGYNVAPSTTTVTDRASATLNTAFRGVAMTPGVISAPIVPTCGSPLTTTQGTATSEGVTAVDLDNIVTGASITSVVPADPGITLSGFTASPSVNTNASATLNVSAAVAANTYAVTITWTNLAIPPQTASCTVSVVVNALNLPVVPSCAASMSNYKGYAATLGVSASDGDGTVTGAAIGTITPPAPTITLSGFTPAAYGGTATATLNIGAGTPVGTYSVPITWTNNDPTPQTATCTVSAIVPTGIAAIQGVSDPLVPSTNRSPLAGSVVTTRGIVTALASNGFYVQSPDAFGDGNANSSEGVFVFVGAAPPAQAVVGNDLTLTGTVAEYPDDTTNYQSATEVTSPGSYVINATGQPLPAPVPIDGTMLTPSGGYFQLERLEGMRVTLAGGTSLLVVAPNAGTVSEPSATSSLGGYFYAVFSPNGDTFRGPGIQWPNGIPADQVGPGGPTIPPVPQFYPSPTMLEVTSNKLQGTTSFPAVAGTTIASITGIADWGYGVYQLYPETTIIAAPVAAKLPKAPTAVTPPVPTEFTVAFYNMQHFYNDVSGDNAAGNVQGTAGHSNLTTPAYQGRLNKASLAIRNELLLPDVIGMAEIENQATVSDLAAKINADEVTAGHPSPLYVGYSTPGRDVGGINNAFLYKTAIVYGTTPRVYVCPTCITQHGLNDQFTDPRNGALTYYNDRPSLSILAVISRASGASYTTLIITNHFRSNIGVDDPTIAPGDLASEGVYVRAKRRQMAVDLANLIQVRQSPPYNENVIAIGDFNAYEFNDGLYDVMGTVTGVPTAATFAVLTDPVSLVIPAATDLTTSEPAASRYSYHYQGLGQVLDHVIASAGVASSTSGQRVEHCHINADFPEGPLYRGVFTIPNKLSDHDPVVGYFNAVSSDLSITKIDTPDPVLAGGTLTYTLTVSNIGDTATSVSVTDTLPAGVAFVSASGAGWTCGNVAGVVTCTLPTLAAGSAPDITIVVTAPVVGTLLSNTATVSCPLPDPNPANNSATATTTVTPQTDLAVTMSANTAATAPGTGFYHSATVINHGPSPATGVTLVLTLPAGAAVVGITPGSSGSCAAVVGSTVTCTIGTLAQNAGFMVIVDLSAAASGTYTTLGVVSGTEPDPNAGNGTASATTTVGQIVANPLLVNMRVPVFSTGQSTLTLTNDSPLTVGFHLVERQVEAFWPRVAIMGVSWQVPEVNASDRTARAVPAHQEPSIAVQPLAPVSTLSFPTGLSLPWGIGLDTLASSVWIGNDDNFDYRFTLAGTPTGDTIDTTSWCPLPQWGADMAYDPYSNKLWQLDVGGYRCIHELDPVSMVWTGTGICPAFGTNYMGLAFDPVTDTFFAGSWNDGKIRRFNRWGTILETVSMGLAISGLAYNPGTHHLFALTNSNSAADLYVIDVNSYSILSSFKVTGMGAYEQAGLEADLAGNLYAVNQATREVLVLPSGETGFGDFMNVPWLDETPKTGTLQAQTSQDITLDFITYEQWPGLHQAKIYPGSTDPFVGVDIPVNYTIAFLDVPVTHWADAFIHGLAGVQVTRGCGAGNYCPDSAVARRDMAVLMVRAMHGPFFAPSAATGVFVDVPVSDTENSADFIEQIYRDGITVGCAVGPNGERYYCPDDVVSRAQMAVFVSRGAGILPVIPPTHVFADCIGNFAESFIEGIYGAGITVGCGSGNFCPELTITRAQLAVWLVKAFNFPYLP